MHEFLRQGIYRDQTPTDLLHPALWGPLAALLLWLAFKLAKDAARDREHREDGSLKGPGFVSPQAFYRRNHSGGVDFELSPKQFPVVGLPEKHPTHVERTIEVKRKSRQRW
jgi:hypothetical protein